MAGLLPPGVIGGPRAVANARTAGADLERELVAERAGALGRMGRRLQDAIDVHQLLVEVGEATGEQVDAALTAVADAAWALVVQRECSGFLGDNLRELRRHYAIPDAAVRRMGATGRRSA